MNIYKFLSILLACFIIGVVIGMVSFVFFGGKEPFLIPYLTAPSEEQESIQKEGVERIDTLQFDGFRRIGVFRDNKRNVTCWIDLNKGGISCIPGHMLSP